MGIELVVANLTMKYLVYLSADYANIQAATFQMDYNATIDVSGRAPTNMTLGTPKARCGAGAGYATVGGSGALGQANNTGGPAYGTLFRPRLGGSMGGSRNVSGTIVAGGRGGSTMLITVGDLFSLEGNMWSTGAVGPAGTDTGGGSGGAIMPDDFCHPSQGLWRGYG